LRPALLALLLIGGRLVGVAAVIAACFSTLSPFTALQAIPAAASLVTIAPLIAVAIQIAALLAIPVLTAVAPSLTRLVAGLTHFAFVAKAEGHTFIDPALIIKTILLTLRPLFLLARPAVGQHAEIMVGKLQIIFELHPITRHLCFARQILVLFEQLRGIAARAIVNPVTAVAAPRLTPALRTLIVIAATSAAVLAIVHRLHKSLSRLTCAVWVCCGAGSAQSLTSARKPCHVGTISTALVCRPGNTLR
jgi:hypothetical protein